MIKNGLKPVQHDDRDFSFHKTFGAISPIQLPPEYDVDAHIDIPDQNTEGLPFGCTGFAQADLCQDEDKIDYSAKEIYDKTLELEGQAGNYNIGCDIRDSLKIICTYYGRGGYYNVQPTVDFFDGIRSALWMNRDEGRAVSIGAPWFQSFNFVGPSGIIPETFVGDPMQQPWHNWVISGWIVKNGQTYLKGKPWQGKNFGDNGWIYFSRRNINDLLAVPYTGAFTVSKKAPVTIKTISDQDKSKLITALQGLISALSDWVQRQFGKRQVGIVR